MKTDKTRLVKLKEKLVDNWTEAYEYIRTITTSANRETEPIKVSSVINNNKPRVVGSTRTHKDASRVSNVFNADTTRAI